MRWLLSWILFWLGDLVSRWNDNDRRFTEFGFNLYQRLMLMSHKIQGDSYGPWNTTDIPTALVDEACTISLVGNCITIDCNERIDAEELLDWLERTPYESNTKWL